jgi:NAD(P)-dependent dehydrogenase (short-subunit alcohol dehydrogenase family)
MLDPLARFRLDGGVAIVTGASSGLGARFARVLASVGAKVVIAARREDRLEALAGELADAGAPALAVRCDVTQEEDVDRLVEAALSRYGGLDVLVNNAGIVSRETGEESPSSFRLVVETNLVGVWLCARRAGRVMLERGSGAIVNTASISGLVGMDGLDLPSYTAAKAGVINMTRDLGTLWARRGVRVNAIAPGYFPSEMTADDFADPDAMATVRKKTPLGRPGSEQELDGALLFLASDASSYVTGQTLVVDGGWTAW